eukprot:3746841-Pyramimonas_sp.AAC.1
MEEIFGGEKVAAIMINCEGCEYPLLKTILGSDSLRFRFRHIIVQFHAQYSLDTNFDAEKEMCDLRKLLVSYGYCPGYSFNWLWEAWSQDCVKTSSRTAALDGGTIATATNVVDSALYIIGIAGLASTFVCLSPLLRRHQRRLFAFMTAHK